MGDAYSEYSPRPGQSEIFLGTQAVISAKDQIREHRYSFARHIHRSIEVYLISSGCCSMDINAWKILCKAGDFIMIPPNTVHSFYLETEDVCTFRHIHFNPDLFSQWYLNQAEPYPLDLLTALIVSCGNYIHLVADETTVSLVSRIIDETSSGGVFSAAMANLHIAELILHMTVLIRPDMSLMTGSSAHTPEHIRYVSYALSYIHENFAGKILIEDIAGHLNISSRYLSKVFFQHMNLTILNYINLYRINQAIELMPDTELTLTNIAALIGLKDSQHFSKLFRSIIGLPPNQYRKLLLHEMSESSPDI